MLGLAWKSLLNRRTSAILTIVAVALSVALFLGVDKMRKAAKTGFDNTISGTDLIVGAPSGQINLLLYSVFRLGNATAEISWSAYQALGQRADVDWAVPISLGDSHRGYRVIGTTQDYFTAYKYGQAQTLRVQDGEIFEDIFDAVIGASVARELGYEIGTPLILTHGLGQAGFADHDNRPFKVVGILAPTGTPVDRSIHIPLEGITAIHVGWETGAPNPLAEQITEDMIRGFDLTPKTVTAVFIGLKNRATVLRTRRAINTRSAEPLQAIMPAFALAELWDVIGAVETLLLAISAFVVAVGLVSVLTSILSSLSERRREMSILRATGAGPGYIFTLLVSEAVVLGFLGAALGIVLVQALILLSAPVLSALYGIALSGTQPGLMDLMALGVVTVSAGLLGFGPAILATRRSLADGLTVKL